MEKKKRILMVLPNQRWANTNMEWSIHPYAICALIAVIKEEYEVGFVDANIDNLSIEDLKAKIIEFAPDLVGVSVLANAYMHSGFLVCNAAKEVDPNIVTVMGGVFCTTRPERAMECNEIDYIVIGEGEKTFPDLLSYIFKKVDFLPKEGVGFRKDGKVELRPRVTFLKDLDSYPLPDYSLVDYKKYSVTFRKSVDAPRALPYGKLMTSRGCPIGCVFCQVENIMGKPVRQKSANRVIQEIAYLIDNFGIKALEFDDDQLLGKPRLAKELLRKMAEQNWDLIWNAMNISVFLMDEEMVDLMYASGCRYLSMAIESGSPRVLKEIVRKPVKLEHAKKIADYARKVGIDTTALFIIGFPGETWQEIRQTIDYAEYINTDYVKFNVATAFPDTKLHKLALETNSLDPNFDFDNVHWGRAGINTDEFEANEVTALRALEWDRINFSTPEKCKKIAEMMRVTDEELTEIRRKTREELWNAISPDKQKIDTDPNNNITYLRQLVADSRQERISKAQK